MYLSRTYLWAAEFPDTVTVGGRELDISIGNDIAKAADSVTQWMHDELAGAHERHQGRRHALAPQPAASRC